ncbi:hypothetical protein DCCM_4331 [Desulfocucumis palustris]|uniref:Uncharacterized protein n=1 Tax=Desulfocucumis palustris TaxID=1898651 RepID=A0A2L2XG34_9FIRM|nr:hypothetical protein [Desulfocucumis palustris]GBF35208.1 hypothetical protein DCCM_4331 [Desulfocucumis palustris]
MKKVSIPLSRRALLPTTQIPEAAPGQAQPAKGDREMEGCDE